MLEATDLDSRRGTHDAQKLLFINLSSSAKGINKRVLEIDISKCFDRISHKTILDRVIIPHFMISSIRKSLKSGINPEFPKQGTPQGGVFSPLLANIALNGIEKIGEYRKSGKTVSKCIRYADDMVYILKPQDNAEEILAKVEEFLSERGMDINQKKTKVTASTDGFNFLGWHFYVQRNNGKFRSIPSSENFKSFRSKVKHIVNNSNYGASTKVAKLAPIVRGWRYYHKYCKMEGSRLSLWGLAHRTYLKFLKQKTINRTQAEEMVKTAFPNVGYSENRFVNVQGEKSPFDGDINYWSKRNSVLYEGLTAKALRQQSHSCGYCKLKFIEKEKIELHHIDGNHDNWNNKNLLAIHSSCHHYLHMSKIREESRHSEAECGETSTLGFHREVRSVIAPIDSTPSLN